MACNEMSKLYNDTNETEKEEVSIKEPIKVYLRIRPLTVAERNAKEDQGCTTITYDNSVELRAPASSFTFKTACDATTQFSFSHIFPDDTDQKTFFDKTMLPFVEDVLNGHNGLVFTYGVTNSGKTYTVLGSPSDGGILPRALDVIFNSISEKKYTTPNLKPTLFQNIVYLDKGQESKETDLCNAIFTYGEKENNDISIFKKLNSTSKNNTTLIPSRENSLISNFSVIQRSGSGSFDFDIAAEVQSRVSDTTTIDIHIPSGVKFGMWISFMEIYNEVIYDLLQLDPICKGKKRPSLKLGEDKNGNPYVKGLTEVFVTSSEEAYKVLRVGQKNRHMAATKLNQLSSRSHAIFSVKLLKIIDDELPHVSRMSRLSIVDLAGSERSSKTDAFGEVLKEASNINCSIMTLGKCISTLRYNQQHTNHPTIVPFRESKLTRLFQSYFLGKGKASMIVNISPCASAFDETYNVLKFSSVAKEVKTKAERATEMWTVPPTPKTLGTPLAKVPSTPIRKRIPLCIVTPSSTMMRKERSLNEPRDFSYDELVDIVKELNEKVKKERREKVLVERNVREEITGEMSHLMEEMKQSHNSELEEQKESLHQMMEDRLDLMAKTVEKHRKRKKIQDENDSDSYVSTTVTQTEKVKLEEMQVTLDKYVSHIKQVEAENKTLRHMEESCKEAEETLRIQNRSMKDMQKKLQDKNDEIEKLQEELDDSQHFNTCEDKVIAEEKEDNNKIEELQVKLEALDNEKTIRIEELERKLDALNQDLKLTQSDCQNQLEELQQKLKTKEEAMSLLQFEYDEGKCKIEKYESLLSQHKETFVDSGGIIEQLNEQLFVLKAELGQCEGKSESDDLPLTTEVGINTSLNSSCCSAADTLDVSVNTSSAHIDTAEIGINTSVVNVREAELDIVTADFGVNTSITSREEVKSDVSSNDVGTNTSIIYAEQEQLSNSKQQEMEFTTPSKTMEPLNEIESIEGFKLEVKMSKIKDDKEPVTPEKYGHTPRKLVGTPQLLKNSPYSPVARVNMQQTIKQLEKLLQEAKKDVEKKSSIIVTRNNHIQQLESQLNVFEKKSNIKKIVEEKQALQEQIATLRQEIMDVNRILGEKNDLLCTTDNELKVWIGKAETCQSKLDKATAELTECQANKDMCQQEMQTLLDQHLSKISSLSNLNAELRKEAEPMKTALAESEELKKVMMQKDEEQLQSIAGYMKKVKEMEENLSLRNNELDRLRKHAEEKEKMLTKMEQDKESLMSNTEKLRKEMGDRRKSRALYQDTIESSIEGFRERISALRQENDENLKEISILNQTVFEVQSKSRDMELRYEETIAGKDEQIEDLEKSKKTVAQEVESLKGKISQFEVESYKLTSSNMKLTMKINRLEQDILDKEELTNSLESDLVSLKEKHAELVTSNGNMTLEISELQRREVKLVSENEENFKNILKCEEELKLKESEVEVTTKELNDIRNDYDNKLRKIEEIEEERNNNKIQFDSLTKEAQEAHEENVTYQNKIDQYEREIIENKTLIESLTIEVKTLKLENSDFLKTTAKYELEKDELKQGIETMKSTIKDLEVAKSECEETGEKEINQHKAIIGSLKNEIEEFKLESSNYLKTSSKYEVEIDEYRRNIEALRKTVKDLEEAKSSLEETSGNEITQVQAQVESLTNEVDKLKSENSSHLKTISQLEIDLGEYKEEVGQVKSTLKEIEAAKELLEESSKKEISENKALIESLKNDVEELKLAISQFEVDICKYKEQIESLNSTIRELESEKKEASNVDVLTKQLNEMKTLNESHVKEINKYKTELSLKEEYICDNDEKRNENNEFKVLLAEKEKTLKQLRKEMSKQENELKRTKEEKQRALDELLATNLAAENTTTCVRRSARKGKQAKPSVDKSATDLVTKKLFKAKTKKGSLADSSSAAELDVPDEKDVTIVEEVSIACSPLQMQGDLESTRFDNDTCDTTAGKLSINLTTSVLHEGEDLDLVTPIPRKKKRLLSHVAPVFEASPDGIERTTGNEASILEATLPMEIAGRRVTRSSKRK